MYKEFLEKSMFSTPRNSEIFYIIILNDNRGM